MFKAVVWILRRFWFPILVFVLGRLGRKHEWAAQAHATVKRVK
jgi:uncharacterized membrane protein YoaK (UPF0700 family)